MQAEEVKKRVQRVGGCYSRCSDADAFCSGDMPVIWTLTHIHNTFWFAEQAARGSRHFYLERGNSAFASVCICELRCRFFCQSLSECSFNFPRPFISPIWRKLIYPSLPLYKGSNHCDCRVDLNFLLNPNQTHMGKKYVNKCEWRELCYESGIFNNKKKCKIFFWSIFVR